MKFLCDQCKAKYQIADEKVVGKTVKMKCRKCGHMIEVRAAVTGAVEGAGDGAPMSQSMAQTTDMPPRSGALSSTATSTMPGHSTGAATTANNASQAPMATSLSRMPQTHASQTGMGAVRPGARDTRDNRDALAGAFTTSVKEDAPSSRSLGLSPADEWYVAINGVPVGPVRTGELRRKAAAGAVTEDSLCWQEGFEEWRPVRSVQELAMMVREAVAASRVSLSQAQSQSQGPPTQSLGPSGDRRSSAPPRPPSRPSIQRVVVPSQAPAPVHASTSPFAPAAAVTAGAAAARSNVVPFAARAGAASTAERIHPEDAETFVGPNPSSASPQTAARAVPGPANGQTAGAAGAITPSVAPDPFAVPASATGTGAGAGAAAPLASPFTQPAILVGGPAVASASAAPIGFDPIAPSPAAAGPGRRPLSVGAMAMIAMCGLFGVTAAVALFIRPATAPVVATAASATATGTASAPSATGASTTTAASDIPPPEKVDDPVAAASAAGGSHAAAGAQNGSKVAANAATAASASGKPIDPSIAALLTGGPSSGPSAGGGNGSGNGTGSLTQDQIEAVVRSRSAQVKRSCWERGGSGKSNNTTVAMTIAGNGSVSSANASGNDPAMSSCIEKAVKGWTFPASGGSTPVNIPFHFVAQ